MEATARLYMTIVSLLGSVMSYVGCSVYEADCCEFAEREVLLEKTRQLLHNAETTLSSVNANMEYYAFSEAEELTGFKIPAAEALMVKKRVRLDLTMRSSSGGRGSCCAALAE